MPLDQTILTTDVVSKYLESVLNYRNAKNLLLIDTKIKVQVKNGIARVSTVRTFKNNSDQSVEATLTLPVPIHATLVGLNAQIEQRKIQAFAKAKHQARETYEQALDDGKTTVLHEELMRGIHMLSVGHIAAGKEVTIELVWLTPVVQFDSQVGFRIPTCVGDIYGTNPLTDSDRLINNSTVIFEASLEVSTDSGNISVIGERLTNNQTRVRLDHPIDIQISNWYPSLAQGVSANGQTVNVLVKPHAIGFQSIDAEILLDISGSMSSNADGNIVENANNFSHCLEKAMQSTFKKPLSKFDVAKASLIDCSAFVKNTDRVRLWEYDFSARLVQDNSINFTQALNKIKCGNGGTDIGASIEEVLKHTFCQDIIVITDGKSYDLDVQKLALSGKRFSIVLIGEDSFEANIGHLAALTGGQLFAVSGLDAKNAIRAAFDSLRSPYFKNERICTVPLQIETAVSGMSVKATWQQNVQQLENYREVVNGINQLESKNNLEDTNWDDDSKEWKLNVGALAASLAIPFLDETLATSFAESHNIVCHLTSLVLVDEQSEIQNEIPVQCKVPMMNPRTSITSLNLSNAVSNSASAMNMVYSSGVQSSSFLACSQASQITDTLNCSSVSIGAPLSTNPLLDSNLKYGLSFDEILQKTYPSVSPIGPGMVLPGFVPAIPPVTTPVYPSPGILNPVLIPSMWIPNPMLVPIVQIPIVNPNPNPGNQYGLPEWVYPATVLNLVDWNKNANKLTKGDLSSLEPNLKKIIESIATGSYQMFTLASVFKISTIVAVLLLVAHADSVKNRSAERFVRKVLNKHCVKDLDSFIKTLCTQTSTLDACKIY